MSNPSLQEQLQALVPTASSAKKKEPPKKQTFKKKEFSPSAQKPAWLDHVFYGIELLKAHYPLCFKERADVKPLKVGIKQDLIKQLGAREDIAIADKSCMIRSLSYYVTTLPYFKSVVAGEPRIDLEGKVVGTVTAEEASYSREQHQAKLQKKAARTQAP